jgi:hypothetical protein
MSECTVDFYIGNDRDRRNAHICIRNSYFNECIISMDLNNLSQSQPNKIMEQFSMGADDRVFDCNFFLAV